MNSPMEKCLRTPNCDCPLFHSRGLLNRNDDAPGAVLELKQPSRRVKRSNHAKGGIQQQTTGPDPKATATWPAQSDAAQPAPDTDSVASIGTLRIIPSVFPPVAQDNNTTRISINQIIGDVEDAETSPIIYQPFLNSDRDDRWNILFPQDGFKILPILNGLCYEDIEDEKNRREDPLRNGDDTISEPCTEIFIYDSDDELPPLTVSPGARTEAVDFSQSEDNLQTSSQGTHEVKVLPASANESKSQASSTRQESELKETSGNNDAPIADRTGQGEEKKSAPGKRKTTSPGTRHHKIKSSKPISGNKTAVGLSLAEQRRHELHQVYKVAPAPKKFLCPICGLTNKDFYHLSRHLMSHTGFKFKCSKCNQAFRHNYHQKFDCLLKHEKTCDAAKNSSKRSSLLAEIKPSGRKTTTVKPLPTSSAAAAANRQGQSQFLCVFCDKNFSLCLQLKLHLKNEHDERCE